MDEKTSTVADETRAIRAICTALNKLPADAQSRVLDFVYQRGSTQQVPQKLPWETVDHRGGEAFIDNSR